MKNILITGGAGFIGSHLAEHFAINSEFDNIVLIDNFARKNFFTHVSKHHIDINIKYLEKYDDIRFYRKDIRKISSLKNLIQEYNFSIIFHAAGQTAVTYSIKNPYDDYEHNVKGTVNILEAIRSSNSDPKLFFFSSNKVFGTKVNDLKIIEEKSRYNLKDETFQGISEHFPIDQCHHSPYGISKLCSDLYIQEFGYTYGLDYIIFRMSCIYGPRQLGVEAQGWIAHLIISALKRAVIKIYGNGKQVRDILHISDLLRCIDSILRIGIKKDLFCIGGGMKNTISILELINLFEEILNYDIQYEFQNWRIADQKIYISDIRKVKKKIGWNPKISPKKGIRNLISWYKNNKNYL